MRHTLYTLALAFLTAAPALHAQNAPARPAAPAQARQAAQNGRAAAPQPEEGAPGAAPEAVTPGHGGAPATAPVAPAARPLATPQLDAQALSTRDPELAGLRKEVEELRLEKSKLEAELALTEAKRRLELAPLQEERATLEAERALRLTRLAAKHADLDLERARLERQIAARTAQANELLAEKSRRLRELENEGRLLKAETENAIAAANATIALRRATDDAARIASAEPERLDEPLQNGVLTISDRRIPFNGPVTDALADFVESRIEFFNNKDPKKPIFIVIDSSPGGSVFSGLRILKAMEGSSAPIIVVVKQYAASMAAITTTLAHRSYCFPNTIILHHQMSTTLRGNMTDLRQGQKFAEDLYERTFRPVYTKLGYADSAAFEAAMYKHFVDGDWAAFGDDAAKMKWVTATVDSIVETGIREIDAEKNRPTPTPTFARGTTEQRDETGRIYYELPLLTQPGDAWVLHDPEGRFQTRR